MLKSRAENLQFDYYAEAQSIECSRAILACPRVEEETVFRFPAPPDSYLGSDKPDLSDEAAVFRYMIEKLAFSNGCNILETDAGPAFNALVTLIMRRMQGIVNGMPRVGILYNLQLPLSPRWETLTSWHLDRTSQKFSSKPNNFVVYTCGPADFEYVEGDLNIRYFNGLASSPLLSAIEDAKRTNQNLIRSARNATLTVFDSNTAHRQGQAKAAGRRLAINIEYF